MKTIEFNLQEKQKKDYKVETVWLCSENIDMSEDIKEVFYKNFDELKLSHQKQLKANMPIVNQKTFGNRGRWTKYTSITPL